MIKEVLFLYLVAVACSFPRFPPSKPFEYGGLYSPLILDSVTMNEKSPFLVGITYNLTYLSKTDQQRRDTELNDLWLIDDQPITSIFSNDFGVSRFINWGDIVQTTFELSSNQNIEVLKDRVIKHVVQLLLVDYLYTDTLDEYSVIKFEVELSGNDIIREIKDKTTIKNVHFDQLYYDVDTYRINNLIIGTYYFPFKTAPKVKKVSALLEGMHTFESNQEQKFVQYASSCNKDGCQNSNSNMTMLINEKMFNYTILYVSDYIIDNVPGVLTLSVETSNVLNSKVIVSFDLTHKLYKARYSGKKFLTGSPVITDLLLARGNNYVTFSCSALGPHMYLTFKMLHILPNGQELQVPRTYRAFSLFKTTEYFKLPDDVVKSGTYECRVTNTNSIKSVEKSILVN